MTPIDPGVVRRKLAVITGNLQVVTPMYKTAYSETVCKCWLPLSNLFDTNAYVLTDRLGPINDVLVALTARGIGAAVVTSNVLEFLRIAAKVRGLRIVAP